MTGQETSEAGALHVGLKLTPDLLKRRAEVFEDNEIRLWNDYKRSVDISTLKCRLWTNAAKLLADARDELRKELSKEAK